MLIEILFLYFGGVRIFLFSLQGQSVNAISGLDDETLVLPWVIREWQSDAYEQILEPVFGNWVNPGITSSQLELFNMWYQLQDRNSRSMLIANWS